MSEIAVHFYRNELSRPENLENMVVKGGDYATSILSW